MTDQVFSALYRFLVEYAPPDPLQARRIWARISALLGLCRDERKEDDHELL